MYLFFVVVLLLFFVGFLCVCVFCFCFVVVALGGRGGWLRRIQYGYILFWVFHVHGFVCMFVGMWVGVGVVCEEYKMIYIYFFGGGVVAPVKQQCAHPCR